MRKNTVELWAVDYTIWSFNDKSLVSIYISKAEGSLLLQCSLLASVPLSGFGATGNTDPGKPRKDEWPLALWKEHGDTGNGSSF